jgi:hypothetical protein
MIIVETDREKELFLTYWNNEESIVIPIWEDLERHPMNNSLSFLYIRFRDEETDFGDKTIDYIIPFNHNDCEKLQIDLSESVQPKWIWNKKGFLQTDIEIQNLKDIQTALFFNGNKLYPFGDKLEVLTNFYTRLGMRDDLGKSLPIMKWGEVLKDITNEWNLGNTTSWIDDTMIPLLSEIERMGIQVGTEKFIDRWPDASKHLLNGKVFTEYNPYTITSRPSNRHGGVNYSALNKKDGSREIFIPKPGHIFLQMDYDAYHVRLIGKLIKYDLPTTSVHQWLADQYGCSYDESKGRTFRILYGGVSEEDRGIPFFQKVDEFIEKLKVSSTERGYLQTPKGRRIPLEWIESPTAQKYFNYLLQATETEFNIEVMKRLKEESLPLPILYVYDSFLFEFPTDGDTNVVKGIKSVLESFGFPIKASWGMDYSKV